MKVGLIGNPNVGKSTIFNALTGMHQHTGNWPGKTTVMMSGNRLYNGINYNIIDLPGTYSLMAHSKEEEVTRDFVYFDDYDALIVVCDACSLERNLNLVLQVLEVTSKVIVCVNLIDEAKKKGIVVDYDSLSDLLRVKVVPTVARSKKGINDILDCLSDVCFSNNKTKKIDYDFLEEECALLNDFIPNTNISKDVVGIHLLTCDYTFINSFDYKYNADLFRNIDLKNTVKEIRYRFYKKGFTNDDIETLIMDAVSIECEKISNEVITYKVIDYDKKARIIDRYVTDKYFGFVLMLGLLFLVLWITISLANYPSNFLYDMFFKFENVLYKFLTFIHVPNALVNALVYGVYRVLAWVTAVMLPPMAIFFPLFTILEDFGYLPRLAFTLDSYFERCGSCGKQALTMVEGFGCNAVGVTGARIIDSPRERLIAIITNVFVPCNGRFPLLISLITMFFVTSKVVGSFVLTIFIVIGILITFIVSKLLSKTILKGIPSSFTLEMPPYRRPQIGKVIIRSIFDRSLFVLKRAVIVSAPAGLIIWICANVYIGNASILELFTNFLDPFARTIGLDGVILMAFILGFPANEIVIPIMIMGYMSLGYIVDISNLKELKELFINNNWTITTAINTVIFSLVHFPCMTTLLTIKKETGSFKWTFLSFLIPTVIGIFICFIINLIGNIV